ncbi:EstA family serine hydrolase [Natronolimnohabitans innermongolicus]|uniref:Beta-lactamase n=1 Tax=Natronolimnohabitans innermongolicus JCM 12255 TaxID=1227499 RepID=L9XK67_9EURY|nr:EstA family serine hydrolase [Natronolimnohabitans innermongolicus]ELY62125.1 beta-lactamase [Natronolimnohabitans innermongolicus JCM 12255]
MGADEPTTGRRAVLSAFGSGGLLALVGRPTAAQTTRGGDGALERLEDGLEETDEPETIVSGLERVERLFQYQLDQGLHHGAQLAVYRGEELVVDLAGGITATEDGDDDLPTDEANPDGSTEQSSVGGRNSMGFDNVETEPDSRFVLFSNTKPLAAACVHVLADEGALEFDDPIVDHWPEFADEDSEKALVTVRHVLTHQSGLPETPVDWEYEVWTDPDALAAGVEEADLEFSPGEETSYQFYSFGWIVGELVRQVTGERIDEFAREHVFEPLGMDRTHIGRPDDEDVDVATLVGFEPYDRVGEPGLMAGYTTAEAAETYNREDVQEGINPAWTGIGPARELARFYACYLNGGKFDGTRLLSEDTVAEAIALHVEEPPTGGVGTASRYGLGFQRGGALPDRRGVPSPAGTFGHGGLGSSMTWAEPETDLAFAFVCNGIRDGYEHDARIASLSETVRSGLA